MSVDITIHHCRLQLSRRGGWSWGSDPRALLRAAVERLPALIGERLAAAWPDGGDCELAAPLRIRIPLRLDELRMLAESPAIAETTGQLGTAAPAIAPELALRIDMAVTELVRQIAGTALASAAPTLESPAPPAPVGPSSLPLEGGMLPVLLDWQGRGVLQAQLLRFSMAALLSWHAHLLCTGDAAPVAGGAPLTDLDLLAGECAIESLPLPPGARAALIRRISLMAAAAVHCALAPGDARLIRAFTSHRAFDLPDADAAPPDPLPAAPAALLIAPRAPAGAAQRPHRRLYQADVKVASVLPFLLLGPLSRSGYLQVLGAVFEAAGLRDQLPLFACALARKVLAPARRGPWGDVDLSSAAAFAGLEQAPDGQQLAALSSQLAPFVSPLDAAITDILASGHRHGAGLLLQAAPPGWLLCDGEGMFPIAWAERIEQLFALMASFDGELLMVPENAVQGDLLARLDGAGLAFVTDAAPARDEDWRAVHTGALRAWSNDHLRPAPVLATAARQLVDDGAASAALWQALMVLRPATSLADTPAVERSLALAAALALGTIGWTLWREREAVTPLLALERFADFDGVACFRADRVEVRLPLGRRFFDLERAGLLAELADVPWFDRRPLRFVRS